MSREEKKKSNVPKEVYSFSVEDERKALKGLMEMHKNIASIHTWLDEKETEWAKKVIPPLIPLRFRIN